MERQGDPNSAAEFQALIQNILAAQPDNLAALLELARIAAKRGDSETVNSAVTKLAARSSPWPPEVQEPFAALQAAADAHRGRPQWAEKPGLGRGTINLLSGAGRWKAWVGADDGHVSC